MNVDFKLLASLCLIIWGLSTFTPFIELSNLSPQTELVLSECVNPRVYAGAVPETPWLSGVMLGNDDGKMVVLADNYIRSNYSITEMQSTQSMQPTMFGNTTKAICYYDFEISELETGDIIIANNVLHRIQEIGVDDLGWFAVTQGDNATLPEISVRRVDDVHCVVVGVLY